MLSNGNVDLDFEIRKVPTESKIHKLYVVCLKMCQKGSVAETFRCTQKNYLSLEKFKP